MKLTTTLAFSALLLALASVAGAADTVNLAPAAVQAQVAAPVTSQSTFEPNCDLPTSSPFFQVVFEIPTEGFGPQTCGACSDTQCQGANRGQMCWTGGVNGQWGNCNIYSGGYRCDTGGWECQCGVGPLP